MAHGAARIVEGAGQGDPWPICTNRSRAAFTCQLGHAVQVADPFHVVAVGTRAVDTVHRRVQQETLGHRGRKGDPLYRARKLLAPAAERLDAHGKGRLAGLLGAVTPTARSTTPGSPRSACGTCTPWPTTPPWPPAGSTGSPKTSRTAPCPSCGAWPARRWRGHILAWHTTGASNG
ncbi:MAG: hypothetical protein GEU78_19520, partial [Actinobacteria bacterium]|nr:hypothetical protein [Actinomycetota bacterium]